MSSKPASGIDPDRRAFLRGEFLKAGDGAKLEPAAPGSGLVVLDESECMAWNGVVCMSCRLACRDEAIAMDPRGRPSVDREACTGCGLCIDVCPPRAIAVDR
jgi:ferredoxin-type protein NapF